MNSTTIALLVIGIASLILGVWALIDLWRGPYTVVGKIGWTFGIVIIPIIMSVLYLVSRPSSKMQQRTYEINDSAEDIIRKYGHDGDL
jgi:hypothetical protein